MLEKETLELPWAGLEHTVADLAALSRELDAQRPFILGRIQVQALVPHVRITKLHCYCKHCTLYRLGLGLIHGLDSLYEETTGAGLKRKHLSCHGQDLNPQPGFWASAYQLSHQGSTAGWVDFKYLRSMQSVQHV